MSDDPAHPDTAGPVYAAFIKDNLQHERDRQSSLQQRGMTVVTTSGALLTLLLGLASFTTPSTSSGAPSIFHLSGTARSFLTVPLILFALAAIAGVASNLTWGFKDAEEWKAYESKVAKEWNDPAGSASLTTTQWMIRRLAKTVERNDLRVLAVLVAIACEALAIASLAWVAYLVWGAPRLLG
jgi:hypothetical protein